MQHDSHFIDTLGFHFYALINEGEISFLEFVKVLLVFPNKKKETYDTTNFFRDLCP